MIQYEDLGACSWALLQSELRHHKDMFEKTFEGYIWAFQTEKQENIWGRRERRYKVKWLWNITVCEGKDKSCPMKKVWGVSKRIARNLVWKEAKNIDHEFYTIDQ